MARYEALRRTPTRSGPARRGVRDGVEVGRGGIRDEILGRSKGTRGRGLQDGTNAVFYVKEKVVDEALDVVGAVGRGECAEADGQKPDVEVGDGEP